MPDSGPTARVIELLHRRIASLGQLEILLLARTTAPRGWTVAQVSAELRTSDTSALRGLEHLRQQDLVVERAGEYRYQGADPKLDEAVKELQAAYATYPVRVIELIFSRPARAISDFAAAFDLRKGEDDG